MSGIWKSAAVEMRSRRSKESVLKHMRSITIKELKTLIKDVPDDYEVIMEWTISGNTEKTTIAMVNGFAVEDEKREVRLLN
jgi:hypothetical protein